MTQKAKGRGDVAPPAKPSPIAELRRRWPRYAEPLGLLEEVELPAMADKLLLAEKMIDTCEGYRGAHVEIASLLRLNGGPWWGASDHLAAARELKQDADSARKAARTLASFLRRFESYPSFPSFFAETVCDGASSVLPEPLSIVDQVAIRLGAKLRVSNEPGLDRELFSFTPLFLAAVLEAFAQKLPSIAASGIEQRIKHGLVFRESLLRKGAPLKPETACLVVLVYHARQATAPAQDAKPIAKRAAKLGAARKGGNPLYKIAAAFVSATFDLEKGALNERQAADIVTKFEKRNAGAKPDYDYWYAWDLVRAMEIPEQ